jgi:hypothetical protein
LNNQANSYGSGLQDFSLGRLKLPAGAGFAPATNGEVGFDTSANMPVIKVSNLTQQIALTTSNISGQASTALALANPPAQCSGSFATGIQANGNANCSTADVIQLAENLLNGHSGSEKKNAAMSFLQGALSITDAVSGKEIVDETLFRSGLSKILDGTVDCLNASVWAKTPATSQTNAAQ